MTLAMVFQILVLLSGSISRALRLAPSTGATVAEAAGDGEVVVDDSGSWESNDDSDNGAGATENEYKSFSGINDSLAETEYNALLRADMKT